LATFALINFVAAIAGTLIIIYNAQRATRVEIAAAMELAEHLVHGPIEQLARETAGSSPLQRLPIRALEALPLRVRNLRHVRIEVLDTQGRHVSLESERTEHGRSTEDAAAPRWFAALFRHDDRRLEIPVNFGGRQVGTVRVIGQSSDEAAEVWQDLSEITLVAGIASMSALALLYLALGRILHPLRQLTLGLRQLEQGDSACRLSPPRVRELAEIANSFNSLAGALDLEKRDNARLSRRLITVQDDERRRIAMELHDELGACLFGLKANAASLSKSTQLVGPRPGDAMRERLSTLVEIVDRIQTTNRRLLKKILPMSIGHAPISDVIADLVADFQRHDPEPRIELDVRHLARSYGDCIDLTLYRCVQEGLTNAVRHAAARSVVVTLEHIFLCSRDGSREHAAVSLRLSDDGHGMGPGTTYGLGLTGMEERVRALGGTFGIVSRPGGGTSLQIEIPVDDAPWTPMRSPTHGEVKHDSCAPGR